MTKRLLTMLAVAALCATSIVLNTSCDSDDWDESYLMGRWVSTDEPGNEIYLNFADGTGTYYTYQNGLLYSQVAFRWEVSHRKIVVRYAGGGSDVWPFRQRGNNAIEVDFGSYWGYVPFYRYDYSGGYGYDYDYDYDYNYNFYDYYGGGIWPYYYID